MALAASRDVQAALEMIGILAATAGEGILLGMFEVRLGEEHIWPARVIGLYSDWLLCACIGAFITQHTFTSWSRHIHQPCQYQPHIPLNPNPNKNATNR